MPASAARARGDAVGARRASPAARPPCRRRRGRSPRRRSPRRADRAAARERRSRRTWAGSPPPPQRAPRDRRHVARAQRGPRAEDVEAGRARADRECACRRATSREAPSAAGRARRRQPRGRARTARASARRTARAPPPRRRSTPRDRATSSDAPAASCSSAGTYSRPRRQSIARSCQKFVSCSAVHTASDASSSVGSRQPRNPQHEPADRDSPIGGSSRAAPPTRRIGAP